MTVCHAHLENSVKDTQRLSQPDHVAKDTIVQVAKIVPIHRNLCVLQDFSVLKAVAINLAVHQEHTSICTGSGIAASVQLDFTVKH